MKVNMATAPTRYEALESITSRWPTCTATELVPLENSIGRVTACALFSENMLPVYRVSAFDGYAVRSADFADGVPDTTGWTKGNQYVSADTGDDFPDGYDTVIAVEDMHVDENGAITFADDFEFVKGDAIRPAGSALKKGDLLADAHTKITGEIAAALAMGGVRNVPVLKKLKIAFIPTGNELVPTGTTPLRGYNVETNGIMLAGILGSWGAETIRFPIIRDDYDMLEKAVFQALDIADAVIINGGSSVGGEDFNATILQKHAEFFSHGVKAVPGRPVGVAMINGKPVINVPGPAAAAWLAADWMLKGLVHHYYGLPVPKRHTVKAVMKGDVRKGPAFEMLTRVHLAEENGVMTATPLKRGTPLPSMFREGNGFIALPIGCAGYKAGDTVEVELLCGEEYIK